MKFLPCVVNFLKMLCRQLSKMISSPQCKHLLLGTILPQRYDWHSAFLCRSNRVLIADNVNLSRLYAPERRLPPALVSEVSSSDLNKGRSVLLSPSSPLPQLQTFRPLPARLGDGGSQLPAAWGAKERQIEVEKFPVTVPYPDVEFGDSCKEKSAEFKLREEKDRNISIFTILMNTHSKWAKKSNAFQCASIILLQFSHRHREPWLDTHLISCRLGPTCSLKTYGGDRRNLHRVADRSKI